MIGKVFGATFQLLTVRMAMFPEKTGNVMINGLQSI